MARQYPNLCAEMSRKGVKVTDVAVAIDRDQATVYGKMNGKSDFRVREAFAIRDQLFPECEVEYLFGKEGVTA